MVEVGVDSNTAADDLATQEGRSLTTMVLTDFFRNINLATKGRLFLVKPPLKLVSRCAIMPHCFTLMKLLIHDIIPGDTFN